MGYLDAWDTPLYAVNLANFPFWHTFWKPAWHWYPLSKKFLRKDLIFIPTSIHFVAHNTWKFASFNPLCIREITNALLFTITYSLLLFCKKSQINRKCGTSIKWLDGFVFCISIISYIILSYLFTRGTIEKTFMIASYLSGSINLDVQTSHILNPCITQHYT